MFCTFYHPIYIDAYWHMACVEFCNAWSHLISACRFDRPFFYMDLYIFFFKEAWVELFFLPRQSIFACIRHWHIYILSMWPRITKIIGSFIKCYDQLFSCFPGVGVTHKVKAVMVSQLEKSCICINGADGTDAFFFCIHLG